MTYRANKSLSFGKKPDLSCNCKLIANPRFKFNIKNHSKMDDYNYDFWDLSIPTFPDEMVDKVFTVDEFKLAITYLMKVSKIEIHADEKSEFIKWELDLKKTIEQQRKKASN